MPETKDLGVQKKPVEALDGVSQLG